MRTVLPRYALAPACIALALLLHVSPAGSLFPPAGLFVFAVLGAAWFGGAGPGFLTALIGAVTLPQIAEASYPLFGGILDFPRFVTFAGAGLAVGWWSFRRRQIESALRDSEKRYQLVMTASNEGYWDWIPAGDKLYLSPRFLEIFGFPPGTTFAGRAAMFERLSMPDEDRAVLNDAIAEHFAGKTARMEKEFRILVDGKVRWIHATGLATRNSSGEVVRWNGAARNVTGHKLAEEALRVSEERFSLAVAGSYDGIWDIDFTASSVFASARTRELAGLPPGPEVAPLDGWSEDLPLHPEDRPKRNAALDAHLAGNAPAYEGEFRMLQPDGIYRWRHLHGVCVRDADGKPLRMAGSISDVDARRRTENALRESEERYERAMNASDDGHWDWIPAGDKIYASRRLREIYGLSPDTKFVGRDDLIAQIPFHPEERSELIRGFAEHLAGSASRYKVETRFLRGEEARWVQIAGLTTRDSSGLVTRWTGTVRDITERKLAEEALRQSERKLRQAQRLEAIGTLAGGIAHDFNNILGAILGYGEMALRSAPAGTSLRQDLQTILAAGERGKALVDRVLTFSRSGIGDRTPVHVEKVVREALDLLAAGLPPGIKIEGKFSAARAAMLGEPTQVHQLVMNLATNGIQAMPNGGALRVSVRTECFDGERIATVGTVAATDYIVLEVVDSGMGIAPWNFERIFDPFFTTKEVNVGNGLGLSLVHGIVTDVGGAIDVVSARDSGSAFTVYLPRTGDVLEENSGHTEHPFPRGNGQRILVVDDEEPLVRLTTERLKALGYQPMSFTSGAAAMEAFHADPEGFDALITDECMPGMPGSALIREVRRIRKSLPILLISGYVGGMVTIRAYNEGADEVLKKPLSERDLATSLARVFGQCPL